MAAYRDGYPKRTRVGYADRMYLMAIDTATNSGGVAISRNAEVIGVAMLKTPLQYSDKLISYIDFLLSRLDLSSRQIDCLVVAAGPGSFTGLRIGIAAVKGFAQALDLPCIGVSTLDALADRFREWELSVAPLLDARRQQVYGAVYHWKEGRQTLGLAPTVQPPASLARQLPVGPLLLVGDGAQLYAGSWSALRPEARILRTDNFVLTSLCRLGFERFTRGEAQPAGFLTAQYIRPSDAQPAR